MKDEMVGFINWLFSINFGKQEYSKLIIAFAVAGVLVFITTLIRRWLWRKKNFPHFQVVKSVSRWPSWPGESLRIFVYIFAYIVLAVLLLEPINRTRERIPVFEPAYIAIGIDSSMSMLAKTAPESDRSRLRVAKDQIDNLVFISNQEGGSDQLMLFSFTGEPYMETVGFTTDYSMMFLPRLAYVDDFTARAFGFGTDLAKALEFCGKKFPETKLQKICLIFTDGELEGADIRALDTAFQNALTEWRNKKSDIKVYFIAVGSGEKAEKIYKLKSDGSFSEEKELDDGGKPIETRSRPEYLRQAAAKAGAGFAHVKYGGDPNQVIIEALKKEKKIIGYKTTEKVDDVSEGFNIAYLIALGILFFII